MYQYINSDFGWKSYAGIRRKYLFEVGKKFRINLRLKKEYERVHRTRCRQGHVLTQPNHKPSKDKIEEG